MTVKENDEFLYDKVYTDVINKGERYIQWSVYGDDQWNVYSQHK